MNRMKLLGFLFIALSIVGCSKPKIDASSNATMKASIEKVRESLPEQERQKFDNALTILAFNQVNMKDLFAEAATGPGNFENKVRDSLDGKTGEQVIAEANRIQAEREVRQRKQALAEIRELEEKRKKAATAREELQKFQVLRSRFYMEKQEFMGKQPIIELKVKNGTSKAVSRAYFRGTIASPNRSVPWYQDSFNYSIPGGLEPGEEATWKLAPNMFSGWGNVNAPADAIFTVTVEQIDGADGKSIYSVREFTKEDHERLEKLKKDYSDK